jgi:hypothetical protein
MGQEDEGRARRLAKAVGGMVVVAFLIYLFAGWLRSLGAGASATGPGARQSRTDYGENGEPGRGRVSGGERPDAAPPKDRGAR